MRATGVLCTLLLVGAIGSGYAYPQSYGGVQQQQQQEPVEVEPVGAPASELTDEQKEALGEFWWQNSGVFNGPNTDGTVVVVQEPGAAIASQTPEELASPFIPSPSPDCDVLHGCIPWQYCPKGIFTNTGEGLLALRTPSKPPAANTQKLCGQIGNICCRIPDALLAAQQQGQSGGAGPYGGGFVDGADTVEIIEVVSDGGGGVVVIETPGTVVEQLSGGGGAGAGPYGGSSGTTNEGTGSSSATAGNQQGSGSVGIIETTLSGCPLYTHECVPYFQCTIDGEINTSGAGLLDLRVKPRKECTNPEYPETPGLCCKVPGATTPVPTTPKPLQTCPGTRVCVAQEQCNADATVNTSGAGLIDTSLYISCYLNYVDASNFESGVCCEPPPPPAHLEICPNSQVCVGQGVCATLGTATYNPSSVLTCYQAGETLIGECCDQAPPPAPLETCPGSQACVGQGVCATLGTATYNPSSVTTCYQTGGTLVGECCDQPPTPAPPAALVTCPGTLECVETELCNSDGTINTDGGGIINIRLGGKRCYLDQAAYTIGICCQPPTPPPPVTPAPIVTCPGTQICLSQEACTSQSAATGGVVTSYTTCVLDSASYATGVCCDSPIRVVDVCPGNSVCIPEVLCQGDILNDADQYVQYANTDTWTQCPMSGGLGTAGVCCRTPEVSVTTPSPYVPADKCGVRNYGLDLRTPVLLEKDEAQFGEFPWQAIIFFTNFTYKCGASIIDDRWLLTAAHCVHGYQYGDFKVRLGEWQVDKYDEPLKYVDLEIADIKIHPDFKPGPVHNDVALLELATPIQPQYHINSICLPEANQIPAQGTRCFASGWGKNAFSGNFQAILKKVDLPVVEKGYCQELLRKTRLGKWFILDKSFMCAGGEERIDTCEGDGGGPLSCQDPVTGRYFIAGITAWGIGCGQKDIPGVYADVQLFRPWIDGIIYQGTAQQQQEPDQHEQQQQQPDQHEQQQQPDQHEQQQQDQQQPQQEQQEQQSSNPYGRK